MQQFSKVLAGVAAVIALGAAAGQAQAATWLINYQADWGGPATANLTVEVEDVLNAVGGYNVTAITGDVDGDQVSGLIDNPGKPFPSYSADGMFIFDNVVWNGGSYISNPGLFFSGASGNEYNLFSDSSTVYELYKARSGVGYLDHSAGMLTARALPPPVPGGHEGGLDVGGGAVPEPATWALMILGFGVIGAILRRRAAVA